MRSTIILIAVFGTIILTWIVIATIGFLLSDPGVSFRDCMIAGPTIMFSIILGLVSSVNVASDLEKHYDNKKYS